ncbi:hypothetical protein PV04_09812 [Phialophora macrospora]|uniref:Uncharacterized protein n=1 Tax=Phialophora macrospora TaxID=1851006 RepID=A0A0D2FSB6_9EURO|nr:hypothetical protein PV04_09812 [Phialophora macrospora]
MHECTEVFTDMWFRAVWPRRRESPPHLTDWTFLCLVFKYAPEFENLTRKAVFASTSTFEDNDLPLPQWVAGEIALRRVSTIDAAIDHLRDLLNSYMSDRQQCFCRQNCDAMVLGSLIKGLNARGLFPLAEAGALDIPIRELFARLRAMNVACLCETDSRQVVLNQDLNRGLKGQLESTLSKLESQVSDWKLADHLPRPAFSESSQAGSQQPKPN